MSLLGSVLIEPQVIGDVILVVKGGDDFYKPANGAIYDAMVQLYDTHASLDIVQLTQMLADSDALGAVGGVEYLVELANAVPSASNAPHYARLVREKAAIRQLIDAAGEILHDAYTSPDEAQRILENAEQRIFQIAQQTEQTHAQQLKSLLLDTIAMIEANDAGQMTGVPTGFVDLDEMTHGLQRGEMIIVAARPSMGKTALSLNIAEQSGVSSQKLRRSMLNTEEYHKLHIACDELLDAPIFIDDTPGLTMLQARAKARRMCSKHDIKLIVIDYLQLMTAGGRVESRQLEISAISRGVKAMARELNLPVICLSQLNRGAEQREGHRPRMSDLRESGSLEQDADVVMMLHREEVFHRSEPDWLNDPANADKINTGELIIAKQRNGPTGTVNLTWVGETMRFRNHAGGAAGGYIESKPAPLKAIPSGGGQPQGAHHGAADEVDDDLPV
jgi:replicative DNA helicase